METTNKDNDDTALHTFRNDEDGIEVRVFLLNDGRFSVALYDLDAEETFPTLLIFKDEAAAENAARGAAWGVRSTGAAR